MTQKNQNKYNFDIAISLCKQDLEFARKIVKALNPSLKVFFYEDQQEELISKSGPEEFAKKFKIESRIVIILSRKEWSETFYTEIERNAIVDRTAIKNEGYEFLMVIPMIPSEIPNWYPSTKIYADPTRFSTEELARFIEFKVTEEGGNVKSINLEDRYQNILDRIELKKKIVQLQLSELSIQASKAELKSIEEIFNNKINVLLKNIILPTHQSPYSEYSKFGQIGLSNYFLKCTIHIPDTSYQRIVTSQDFEIHMILYKTPGITNANSKLIEEERRLFYYNPPLNGWALPKPYSGHSSKEQQILFRDSSNSKFYDLKHPLPSANLIDIWFQKLLSVATKEIEDYI